ncbi:PadR family transcriptional regulator, partial [Clostridioides difficile]
EGTIYYNFEVLLKKGLIDKVETIQSENRPDKTTYGITEKGRIFLEESIYKVFQKFTNVESLYAALVHLDKVDNQKLAYLIMDIIEKLDRKLEYIDLYRPDEIDAQEDLKDALLLMRDHAYHSIHNDMLWLRKLLDHVQSRVLKST